MKCSPIAPRGRAFALVELFFIAGVLAILTLFLLPAIQPNHHHHHLNCGNNLRQVGLAFRTWALDNDDRFPMGVSTNQGGTSEFKTGPYAFVHFAAMSNELSTPKILLCPDDRKRSPATDFGPAFDNSKVSYFVGVDTSPTNLDLLLSGDRNLTNSRAPAGGMLVVKPGDNTCWTKEIHERKGYLLLADGSVQLYSNAGIGAALGKVNRLAMP